MHSNEFRRGDTFSWSGTAELRDQSGQLVDMTGATAESQLRTVDGAKIADLSVSLTAPDAINIRFFGDTLSWPLGKAQIDVQFTLIDSSKIGTSKQWLEIVEGVTRP